LDRFRRAQTEGDLICTCRHAISKDQQRELHHMNRKWKNCKEQLEELHDRKRELQRDLDSLKPFDAKIQEEKHRRQHATERLRRAQDEVERETGLLQDLQRQNDELDLDIRHAREQAVEISSRHVSDDNVRFEHQTILDFEDKLRQLPSVNELSRMRYEISYELKKNFPKKIFG